MKKIKTYVDLFNFVEGETPKDYDEEFSWEEEWQGMPEFIPPGDKSYAKVIVRFRNKEDLEDFAKIIGQNIKGNASIWHPSLTRGLDSNKWYVDEEDADQEDGLGKFI